MSCFRLGCILGYVLLFCYNTSVVSLVVKLETIPDHASYFEFICIYVHSWSVAVKAHCSVQTNELQAPRRHCLGNIRRGMISVRLTTG